MTNFVNLSDLFSYNMAMLHIYINKYTTCILSITLDMHFYSTFLRSCANTELFPWAKSWFILSETVYGSEASHPECY